MSKLIFALICFCVVSTAQASNGGLLAGSCTLNVAPNESHTFDFKVSNEKIDGTSDDGFNGLAVYSLTSFGEALSSYTLQVYNQAGLPNKPPQEQLILALVYHPPFCNPPTLDGQPQDCSGVADPHPVRLWQYGTPGSDSALSIDGGNASFHLTCSARFQSN